MKAKSEYICNACGYRSAKWLGKCPACGGWGTLEETLCAPAEKAVSGTPKRTSTARAKPLNEIHCEYEERYSAGMAELDRVLGGGIVKGSLILVGGDPGIGKSTLLLQICNSCAAERKILYVSGEESEQQIKLRAERLGVSGGQLYLLSETDIEIILGAIEDTKPDIVIIDSIQTMHHEGISSAAGSVPQVREATNGLMRLAKSSGIAMFIVGHVTKDGTLAGPRVLEHMVDCVLYFEGDRQLSFRILRAVKNRFGSTNEIGVFQMLDTGLAEVKNPSAMLLDGRPGNASGSSVVCAIEGSRGVLAEIQALAAPTGFGNPRRMSSGIDINRVLLMTAVLEKRARVSLSHYDIYVNVAGGLRIDETAADLGLCMAMATSAKDISIPSDMLFIGEVGLGGEIRSVSQLEKRLNEAKNLGFATAIVPKQSLKRLKAQTGIKVIGAASVSEALRCLSSLESQA